MFPSFIYMATIGSTHINKLTFREISTVNRVLLYVYSLFTTPGENDNARYFFFWLWRMRDYVTRFFLIFVRNYEKTNGMKRRHLSGQNFAGVNERPMCFVIAREVCRFYLIFGKTDGR